MLRLILTILTLLAILVPATTFAQSSSACLSLPVDTVNQWASMYPSGDTDNLCNNNCNTWTRTCRNMASASYRCFQALFANMTALDIAECGNLAPPDKGDCISSAQSSLRSLIQNLQSDLGSANSICASDFSDCVDNCNED